MANIKPKNEHEPPFAGQSSSSGAATSSRGRGAASNSNRGHKEASAEPSVYYTDEKTPLFLIKLWNILEDAAHRQIVHWDDTGNSFHIRDPYSFCHDVLPHYFKHNNLNSFIRQLNMYGFRKITALDRSGLARPESDQDHLEFSHPNFVHERPDLLSHIKRKSTNQRAVAQQQKAVATVPDSQHPTNIDSVLEELRQIKNKQRSMESQIEILTTQNTALWEEMTHDRARIAQQQQVVNKLVQFLVALVQPRTTGVGVSQSGSTDKRPKRGGFLALDEPAQKRARFHSSGGGSGGGMSSHNLHDLLDNLQRELVDRHGAGSVLVGSSKTAHPTVPVVPEATSSNRRGLRQGPIIAEVDEYGVPLNTPTQGHVLPNSPYSNSSKPFTPASPTFTYPVDSSPSPGNGGMTGYGAGQIQTRRGHDPTLGVVLDQSIAPLQPQQQQQQQQLSPQPSVSNAIAPYSSTNDVSVQNFPNSLDYNLALSPSIERQITDYLNNMDSSIDSFRDMLGNQLDLEAAPADFHAQFPAIDDLDDEEAHPPVGGDLDALDRPTRWPLALEQGPLQTPPPVASPPRQTRSSSGGSGGGAKNLNVPTSSPDLQHPQQYYSGPTTRSANKGIAANPPPPGKGTRAATARRST